MGIEWWNTYERIKDWLQKWKGKDLLESFNWWESAWKIDWVKIPYIGIIEEYSLSVQYCPSDASKIWERIAKHLCRLYGPVEDDKNKTLDSIDAVKWVKIRTEKPKPNKVKPKRVKRNTSNAIPILPSLEEDEK